MSKEIRQDKNMPKNLGVAVRPPARQPQQAFPQRPHANGGLEVRFGDRANLVPPNNFVIQQPQNRVVGIHGPMVPAAPVVHRPAQQNWAPRPNGRVDGIVKAAGGMVQKAMKRPAPFRGAGFGSPNAMPMPMAMPVSRPRFETFLNKMEILKKRNAEARRLNNMVAQAHPPPFIPQPIHHNHPQMAQAAAVPIPPQMGFHLHPMPGVPGSINGGTPLANGDLQNAGRLDSLPINPGFDFEQLFMPDQFRRS
ncbi:hypothetical protein GGR51DRAFT_248598 [Nemania sp. FL0031]|nr:hypothetical protein GGR51DRAFT_248598 [Nemania sp. FL0031]